MHMRKRRETVPEYEGSNIRHEFRSLLTKDNALEYRKKNIVKAFKTDSSVSFVKEWGVSKGVAGDYVVWNKPGDLYVIAAEEFLQNYIPRHQVHKDDQQDGCEYIKRWQSCQAYRYPFVLPHAKARRDIWGYAGDYVIQPENGKVEDQYIVFTEKFLKDNHCWVILRVYKCWRAS